MKALLIIAFLLLTVSGLNAQEIYLDQNPDLIRNELKQKDSVTFQWDQITKDSLRCIYYIQHKNGIDIGEAYFFNTKTNLCNVCKIVYPISSMPALITDMNKIFIKTKDNEWVTKDMSTDITAFTDEKVVFILYYTKL